MPASGAGEGHVGTTLMVRWIRKRRWVWIPLLLLVIAFILVGRPAFFLTRVALFDRDERHSLPQGIADDVSRLNATHISELCDMPSGENAEQQLRDLLARAK